MSVNILCAALVRARARALISVTAALLVGAPLVVRADVERGWDLFSTIDGTSFANLPLKGLQIGDFNFSYYPGDGTGDFGRGIGVRNVGNADTIVKRLDIATPNVDRGGDHQLVSPYLINPATNGLPAVPPAGAARIGLEMVALQLQTISPTDFGGMFPLDFYTETLQSDRGLSDPFPDHVGNAGDPPKNNDPFAPNTNLSLGLMDIYNANGLSGTFESSLYIKFDLRRGEGDAGLHGPIVYSDEWVFHGVGNWSRTAPDGALLIDNVNYLLADVVNGIAGDFHPIGPLTEMAYDPTPNNPPLLGQHVVQFAAIPEPSTYGLLGLMFCAALGLLRRRKSR